MGAYGCGGRVGWSELCLDHLNLGGKHVRHFDPFNHYVFHEINGNARSSDCTDCFEGETGATGKEMPGRTERSGKNAACERS